MSIDFPCSSCRQTVRVPDGTEGKKTKCPKCQEVQVIPDKNSFGSSAAPAPKPTPPPEQPKQDESIWDGLGAESDPSPPPSSNPFGDQPDPFGPPADNPYLSPAPSASAPRTASREEARSKLMGPAIGVLVSNALAILMLGLGAVITIVEMQEGGEFDNDIDPIAFGVISVLQIGLPFLLTLFSTFAMIRAFQVRNYGVVLTGFILALTPCTGGCCLLSMIFGIWGLVVINDDSVKAAFRQSS